jgi:hypothetical protein
MCEPGTASLTLSGRRDSRVPLDNPRNPSGYADSSRSAQEPAQKRGRGVNPPTLSSVPRVRRASLLRGSARAVLPRSLSVKERRQKSSKAQLVRSRAFASKSSTVTVSR